MAEKELMNEWINVIHEGTTKTMKLYIVS